MHKKSYNKVVLIGRVGADPVGRYTQTGISTTAFSIATNESWKQPGGKMIEHTEWHAIIAWDKLADFVNEYLYKGQLVSIEGSIRTRSWQAQDGGKRKTTEIICSNVIPLEWKTKE